MSECETCGEHCLDCSCPTVLTDKHIDDFVGKYYKCQLLHVKIPIMKEDGSIAWMCKECNRNDR